MIDFEKLFGSAIHLTLAERAQWFVRRMFWKVRVDVCFSESDGFDVGAFVGDWKAARGPFLLHRQMEGFEDFHQYGPDPSKLGPWRLMIALNADAYRGFDDGCCK